MKQPHAKWLGLLLIVAGLIGGYWVLSSRSPVESGMDSVGRDALGSPALSSLVEPAGEGPLHVPASDAADAAVSSPVDAPTRGTAAVFDPAVQVWKSKLDGVLVLRSMNAVIQAPQRVFIESGTWAPPPGSVGRFEIAYLAFDGRQAIPGETEIEVGPGAPPRIEGRWPLPTVLRVLDSRTRLDLDAIELVRAADPGLEDQVVPDFTRNVAIVTKSSRSPIELPKVDGTATYWARTAQHGWGRISISHVTGGGRTLVLKGGSRVDFVLKGDTSGVSTVLRIYHRTPVDPEHSATAIRPAAEIIPRAGAPTTLDGFPDGSWTARIETAGKPPWVPLSEFVPFDTIAEGSTHVDLVFVGRGPAATTMTLTGEIILPGPGPWPDVVLDIVAVEPLDPLVSGRTTIERASMSLQESEGSSTLQWNAGAMAPGTYVLDIRPYAVQQELRLARQHEHVLLEVPPVARIDLNFTTESTGMPCVPNSVNWSPVDSSSTHRALTAPNLLQPDPLNGRIQFVCAPGSIRLQAWFPAGRFFESILTVATGVQVLTVPVKEPSVARVQLSDSGAGVPVPMSWWDDVRAQSGAAPGRLVRTVKVVEGESRMARQAEFFFSVPGTYVLDFPPIDGFEAPPPRQILVEEGRPVRLDVQLTPDRR